jgi:hypothetical protein
MKADFAHDTLIYPVLAGWASSGRADILVRDYTGNSLIIIEYKTYGKEFGDAWKDTQLTGGQLFSYARQEGSTPEQLFLFRRHQPFHVFPCSAHVLFDFL